MGPNPFLGVVFHWIGGFASATNFIPFRGIKHWSWEIYWIIQGLAAWVVAPTLIASIFIPHVSIILRTAPRNAVGYAIFWGALWGLGGLTFGLAIRYLGIALGYAIALGLCTAFGTLIPPIYSGQITTIVHERSGQIILSGVFVCLLAVVVNGVAGLSKEREVTPEAKAEAGDQDFSFVKGVGVAIFAGIFSSFFAFGLSAGAPLAAIAKRQLLDGGSLDLWQNLPVLIVVLWGGFITNLLWTATLIMRNRSFPQFRGIAGLNPMRARSAVGNTKADYETACGDVVVQLSRSTLAANYCFASLAGLIWYFQFFFYSMGQTKMGRYDFSSWALHMASIIIFATLWGLVLHEWRGTSMRTRTLVAVGLALLIASTFIIGYGSFTKATETGLAR